MIPINNPALYDAALNSIRNAVGKNYLGRPAQIFFAAKHYGKAIPQIGDPVGLRSGEIEDLLDDFYLKPSRAVPEKIAIIFESTHKVPSGTTGGVLTYPSNIWRNNLNLQKGYMCFGTTAELLDPQFRNPSRLLCPHLQPAIPGTLAGARCAFNPVPRYRGEDHPKMFRKDPASGEYWIYDPTDTGFYSTIILPANGNKLPLAALIIALYFDGPFAASRAAVDTTHFLADFGFSPAEYALYFEDDPASLAHQRLLAVDPGITWTRNAPPPPIAGVAQAGQPGGPPAAGPVQAGQPGLPPIPQPAMPAAKAAAASAAASSATSSAPPAGGHWWSAEQAVRSILESDGWQVLDVTRVGIGYDFKATKAGTVRLVEVKSAIGPCAPTLTEREYAEAKQSRAAYVLAIVEDYDPAKAVTVRWVQDPARLQVTVRETRAYYLPRSVWKTPSTGAFPA